MYAGLLDPGATVTHRLRPGFPAYFVVVHGSATVDGRKPGQGGLVDEGGAARVADEPELTITAGPDGAEVLLVEVPPA
jgi:redox-sensitive bicupin YhaK (pirin superfamily)